MQGSWGKKVYYTNGHMTPWKWLRGWRLIGVGVVIAWVVALIWTWLMGLGVVKLITIIDGFMRGH